MFSNVAAFLALFAVVSAQGFGNIAIQTQDGNTVAINQDTRVQTRILSNPIWGEGGAIRVQVAGPAVLPKTVDILDRQVDLIGTQQSDILNEILIAFNGQLGEETYQKLLSVIAQKVTDGQINPVVLNALETISNNQQIAQSGVQQLIQNAIAQQGLIQSSIGQQIASIQGPQLSQQAKQALISQALSGARNPLVAAEAELEAEQIAQALGVTSPQSQILRSQILGESVNPLTIPQTLGATRLQGPLAQQILRNQLLGTTLQGEKEAQILGLRATRPQSQLTQQALLNQIIGGSGRSLAAARAQLEAEEQAQILRLGSNLGRYSPIGGALGAGSLGQTGRLSPLARIPALGVRGQIGGPSTRIIGLNPIQQRSSIIGAGVTGPIPLAVL